MNQSIEAEQHIIACALVDETKTAELLELPEEWFQVNAHKLVLRTIRSLASQSLSADAFSIGDELNRTKQLEMVGGMEYLMELTESLPNLKFWNSYKNSLFNYYKINQLGQLKNNLEAQLNSGTKPQEVIEDLQTNLIELLTDHHSSGFRTVESHLDSVLAEVEWRQENKGKLMGQSTGHDALDYAMDGLQDGRVYVLAGRPGSGKTAFALSLADGLAHKEKHWFYFSLEMTGKSLSKRLLVTSSGVSNHKFRSGYFDEPDYSALGAGVGKIQDLKIHVDETPSLSIAQMRSRLKAAQVQHGEIGGIIVDHIGLIKKHPTKSDTESMNMIADDLLVFAKEFDCPLIELCQLNRGVETRTDKHPTMADLKQSGKIEENADAIMLLYRADYYDKQESPVTEVIIAKNRDGDTPTIYMKHDMSVGKYEELENYEPKEKEPQKF